MAGIKVGAAVAAVAVVIVAIGLSACGNGPGSTRGLGEPSSVPAIPPLTFQSRPLSFPSGAARLQIWGHTLISFDAPLCGPLFGSLEGSSVATPVQVERVTSGDATGGTRNSWIVRSDPAFGTIEFRIDQTGTATIYGETVSGRIRGRARDAPFVPGAIVRDLVVNLPDADPPLSVEGHGSTNAPFMEGVIKGAIDFTDSYGGRIDCPQVFWLLAPP